MMMSVSWIFPDPNTYYDPSYPGIPCNITTSPPGTCVSVTTMFWVILGIFAGLMLCVCGFKNLAGRVKETAENSATEKTKLVSIQTF